MSCNLNCNDCKKCDLSIEAKYAIDNYTYDECLSKPGTVFLGVTNRCNLSCPYCFVRQENNDMTIETAIKAVELAIKNAEGQEQQPRVIFFGGEPLLRFDDIIVPIVEKYRDRVVFNITTNGVLLDEDKIDFFYKNNIELLLSFDGIKTVQDTQRPGKGFSSFDSVINNIPYLLFRFPGTCMRATITKKSIPYLYESYCMGKELGFTNFAFCINAYEEWDKNDQLAYQEQLTLIAEDVYVSAIKYGEVYRVTPLVEILKQAINHKTGRSKIDNNIERCGTGTTTFSITPEGFIVPCQEKVSNPTWIIGDVDHGIDQKKHEEYLSWYWSHIMNMNESIKTIPEFARPYCLSMICPSRMEDINFKFKSSTIYASEIHFGLGIRLITLVRGSILPVLRASFDLGVEK